MYVRLVELCVFCFQSYKNHVSSDKQHTMPMLASFPLCYCTVCVCVCMRGKTVTCRMCVRMRVVTVVCVLWGRHYDVKELVCYVVQGEYKVPVANESVLNVWVNASYFNWVTLCAKLWNMWCTPDYLSSPLSLSLFPPPSFPPSPSPSPSFPPSPPFPTQSSCC